MLTLLILFALILATQIFLIPHNWQIFFVHTCHRFFFWFMQQLHSSDLKVMKTVFWHSTSLISGNISQILLFKILAIEGNIAT